MIIFLRGQDSLHTYYKTFNPKYSNGPRPHSSRTTEYSEYKEYRNYKMDSFPSSPTPNKKPHQVAYQDLTGRFPVRSSRGNEYILVGYHFDVNSQKHGNTSTTNLHAWVLDNEVSSELKGAFRKNNTEFQLVPPYSHRRNIAERSIQTYKSYFKAGLATADPNFPLSEWDRLIPQANITLNLLRSARSNPALSAYAYIYTGTSTLRPHH